MFERDDNSESSGELFLYQKINSVAHGALYEYTKIVYTTIEVRIMLKNITLSADERLIEKARKKAMKNNTTLNELFRHWLINYTVDKNLADELDQFLVETGYASSGRSFTRDELNER